MKLLILTQPHQEELSLENLIMTSQVKRDSLEHRVDSIESRNKLLLSGFTVSLAGVLAFAFWLGTINAKVSATERLVHKVYESVSEHPESLLVRTSLVEQRLGNLENSVSSLRTDMGAKFAAADDRMTSLETKVKSVETKVNSVEAKVNSVGVKVISVEAKVNSVEAKVNSMEAKLLSIDAKLNTLVNRQNPE
jgi:peptidoglycan hydrolase CwlO-like protein